MRPWQRSRHDAGFIGEGARVCARERDQKALRAEMVYEPFISHSENGCECRATDASSLMDYLFRWIELKFLKQEQGELFAPLPASVASVQPANPNGAVEALGEFVQLGDAPACNICGSLMVRSGTCYRCLTCGSTSGCS